MSKVFPGISPAQTADARLLMECNTTCTDFVCVAIKQHRQLFPSTSDENPPKRLRLEQMGQMALIHLIFDILCCVVLSCQLMICQTAGEREAVWCRGLSTIPRKTPPNTAQVVQEEAQLRTSLPLHRKRNNQNQV